MWIDTHELRKGYEKAATMGLWRLHGGFKAVSRRFRGGGFAPASSCGTVASTKLSMMPMSLLSEKRCGWLAHILRARTCT